VLSFLHAGWGIVRKVCGSACTAGVVLPSGRRKPAQATVAAGSDQQSPCSHHPGDPRRVSPKLGAEGESEDSAFVPRGKSFGDSE